MLGVNEERDVGVVGTVQMKMLTWSVAAVKTVNSILGVRRKKIVNITVPYTTLLLWPHLEYSTVCSSGCCTSRSMLNN